MKNVISRLVALVLSLSFVVSMAGTASAQDLGGFTPEPKIKILFSPNYRYPVSSQQTATVSVTGPNAGTVAVTISGPGGPYEPLTLTIGGTQTGSNTGTRIVNIPAESGNHTYTASATIANQNKSDDSTITAVKVAKIQWRNADEATASFADAETLTVAQGARLEFKAVADPTGAWPSEKPVWGGAASGTGEAATVSFDSASTSDTDYKTVTAECGNTVEVKVLVVKIDKLQYRVGGVGEWADAPSYPLPLLVATGASVEFQAVRSPSGEVWPGGKPVWSGNAGASGTGPSKTVTFGIASTSDTDFKTVTAECGNTVTVNVLVKNRSGAWVRLYKDEALTQEVGGETPTLGGPVWVALELQVGPNEQVDSTINSVTLRLKEISNLHTEADNHYDVVFDVGTNWQKQEADGTWDTTTESPKTANTGQEPVFYRTKFLWKTTGTLTNADPDGEGPLTGNTLLGHNGAHTISVFKVNDDTAQTSFSFQVANANQGVTYRNGPAAKSSAVKNLVFGEETTGKKVTTNVNEDYFIFDPDSGDAARRQPQLTFKIEDEGEPHQYRWWIYIEPTTQTEPVQSWAFIAGTTPGAQTVTATWNGRAADGSDNQEQLIPGTYTFEIYVEEVTDAENVAEPALDQMWLKSDCLEIAEHYLQINDNIEENRKVEVGFRLSDQHTSVASAAEVDLLDFEFNLVTSTPLPATVNIERGPINIHQLSESEDGAGWRAVFMAADACAARYRDHKNRRSWAVNQPTPGRVIYLIDENTPETANIWQEYIEGAFRNITSKRSHAGITVVPWRTPLDQNHRPTANQVRALTKLRYNRAAVIWEGDMAINIVWPGVTLANTNGGLATPRLSQYSQGYIEGRPAFQDQAQRKLAASNVALHELGHALGMGNDHHHENVVAPFCVMHHALISRFGEQLANNQNPTHFGGRPRTDHAKLHWNAMRAFVGLGPLP